MKQLKKIILSIMIGLISIIGLSSTTNAVEFISKYNYELGKTCKINYWTDYVGKEDVYCVQHYQGIYPR